MSVMQSSSLVFFIAGARLHKQAEGHRTGLNVVVDDLNIFRGDY